mmetsp:Transcript_2736/g.9958  ORF Transcript_2736/g.9958 Transcript_2736/m.9958 type:complete len:274 (+) Transcript_2736:533-1354(+)
MRQPHRARAARLRPRLLRVAAARVQVAEPEIVEDLPVDGILGAAAGKACKPQAHAPGVHQVGARCLLLQRLPGSLGHTVRAAGDTSRAQFKVPVGAREGCQVLHGHPQVLLRGIFVQQLQLDRLHPPLRFGGCVGRRRLRALDAPNAVYLLLALPRHCPGRTKDASLHHLKVGEKAALLQLHQLLVRQSGPRPRPPRKILRALQGANVRTWLRVPAVVLIQLYAERHALQLCHSHPTVPGCTATVGKDEGSVERDRQADGRGQLDLLVGLREV